MKKNYDLGFYKMLCIIGIILMGIGSFMACLASSPLFVNLGTVILCISIAVCIVGFSKWQP